MTKLNSIFSTNFAHCGCIFKRLSFMHAARSSLQFIAFSSLVLARYVLRASQIAVAKAVYGSI